MDAVSRRYSLRPQRIASTALAPNKSSAPAHPIASEHEKKNRIGVVILSADI